MGDLHDQLVAISEGFEAIRLRLDIPEVQASLDSLRDACASAETAFCGSWLGYHARVYYENLEPPPAGARFSPQWGLRDRSFRGETVGEWVEYTHKDMYEALSTQASGMPLEKMADLANEIGDEINDTKEELLSCLTALSEAASDAYIERLVEKTKNSRVLGPQAFVEAMTPSGKFVSNDLAAITNGIKVPPHVSLMAEIAAITNRIGLCKDLAQIARKAISHLENRRAARLEVRGQGTKIFIGHGRSAVWKDLKDFLQNRLRLDWEEFNRISPAGIANTERLKEMLANCRFALLVMTAEDETADGTTQARMNVIHEVGLFQAKLGFSKAIILLEDGCQEFSNVQGIGHIRFPSNNISAAFEQIRQVLEREGIIA